MRPDAPPEADRSVPELLRELGDELATLVRQELALAKVELGAKGRIAVAAVPMFGAGALFGLGAFAALTTFLIAAIALALPLWAAALIVSAVYGTIAAIAAISGKQTLQHAAPIVPEQTAQSVKEDIEWVKTRSKSAAR